MSTFGSLGIAQSGLLASQRSLDVVAKNIANANTIGYTRQRVITTPAAYDMGVDITKIEQVREAFIDYQFRNENNTLGEYQVKTDSLTMMEDFLQEPSDTGLNQMVSNFFTSLQEMSKQPNAKEMRTQVVQNAVTMTDNLHYLYTKLTELQQNQGEQISTSVTQINDLAVSLQTLNDEIKKTEIKGQEANDLRDQRNTILDQLSEYVNITTTENSDSTVSVLIGGSYLVDKNVVNKLVSVADKTNPISTEGLLNSIKWESTGDEVLITGGKLKGYIDISEGTGVTSTDDPKFMGIPYFVDKINMFAKSLVKAVNDIHTTGYTLPNESNGNVSKSGVNFFEPTDYENEVTAKNISVSQEIMNNVLNIATSDTLVVSTNVGNNSIISKIASLVDKSDMTITIGAESFNIGSFNAYSKEIATELALVSADNNNKLEAQQVITQSVENKRMSVSGVSIDEEMTNMIQYQHAYSASARIISAINQNLDTLINSMGR